MEIKDREDVMYLAGFGQGLLIASLVLLVGLVFNLEPWISALLLGIMGLWYMILAIKARNKLRNENK